MKFHIYELDSSLLVMYCNNYKFKAQNSKKPNPPVRVSWVMWRSWYNGDPSRGKMVKTKRASLHQH